MPIRRPPNERELTADDAAASAPGSTRRRRPRIGRGCEELRAQLEQARDWADDERAARAQQELDFIAHELARALGLGGRDRPTASQAERARQNVGRAVHKAVRQIVAALPELGAHLERAVSTGAFCSYDSAPEPCFPFLSEAPTPAVSALPSGTVTVMMTEVEDATRLFARHRPDAARTLRRYQELIDAVVASCRGTPLGEGGVG